MKRRILHIILIAVVALLSIGEAYHYHPDGGSRWHVASFPSAPVSPATDGGTADSGPTVCPLHFWASVFSTVTILLALLLLPPAPAIRLRRSTPLSPPSWSGFALAIRGPPLVLV